MTELENFIELEDVMKSKTESIRPMRVEEETSIVA
jgi:hypothetical protein